MGMVETTRARASLGAKIATGLKQVFAVRESGVLLALVVFFTLLWIISPVFRTPFNLTIILKQMSVVSIVAMGQTLVIISGAFDLSQGPVAGLAAMLTAIAWGRWGWDPVLAISLGLGIGTACGLTNGLLAARFRLHPIVMTLATATIFQGINFFITRGQSVVGLPTTMTWFGKGKIGSVPVPVILMFIVAIVMHIMLTRTLFGLRVRMIGGNLKAGYDSGVQVERVRIGVFTISGFLAALGGIVLLGRVGNAVPQIGNELLFPVVTAAIVGGTLLTGGVGSMAGTLIGAAIMAIVRNALVILQFNIFLQDVAQGFLVVLALLIDLFRRGELTWAILIGKDRYAGEG